jgi:2-hydroxy-3-keto-5-methylthiopentenyl-1-phosphate phosphatase
MAWAKAKLRGLGPTFADCTKVVHASLHEWDRTVLKGPKKIREKLKKELKKMRWGEMLAESLGKGKEIQVLLENLLEQDKIYSMQRGRVNWLMHTDRKRLSSIIQP